MSGLCALCDWRRLERVLYVETLRSVVGWTTAESVHEILIGDLRRTGVYMTSTRVDVGQRGRA